MSQEIIDVIAGRPARILVSVQGNAFVHAGFEQFKIGRYAYGANLSRRIERGPEPGLAPAQPGGHTSLYPYRPKAPAIEPALRAEITAALVAAIDEALRRDPNMIRRSVYECWVRERADTAERLERSRQAVAAGEAALERLDARRPVLLPEGPSFAGEDGLAREAADGPFALGYRAAQEAGETAPYREPENIGACDAAEYRAGWRAGYAEMARGLNAARLAI